MFRGPIIQLFKSKQNRVLLIHTCLPLLCNFLEEHHRAPSWAADFHHKCLMHTQTMSLFWTAQSQMTSRSIQCLPNHLMGWNNKIWKAISVVLCHILICNWQNVPAFLNGSAWNNTYNKIQSRFDCKLTSKKFLVQCSWVWSHFGYKQVLVFKTELSYTRRYNIFNITGHINTKSKFIATHGVRSPLQMYKGINRAVFLYRKKL